MRMSENESTERWLREGTRLIRPGERLVLPHAIPGDCVEEMRSLEIEREHDVGTERRESLRGSNPRGHIVAPRSRVDERLIAERLYEIESCCSGGRGNPWSCDY